MLKLSLVCEQAVILTNLVDWIWGKIWNKKKNLTEIVFAVDLVQISITNLL